MLPAPQPGESENYSFSRVWEQTIHRLPQLFQRTGCDPRSIRVLAMERFRNLRWIQIEIVFMLNPVQDTGFSVH